MLKTEMRNPASTHLDKMSTIEIVRLMQAEWYHALDSIEPECDTIAAVADAIACRMAAGGRLFCIGCGTSGRIAVADAAECPPTFGISSDRVIGIIAGGTDALTHAVEGAEDDAAAGARDLTQYRPDIHDTVIGISAAGGAPYVISALRAAKDAGALTVSLTSNAGTPVEALADYTIHPDTGAEVLSGSTRLKAGTAQKLILNMISTAVMVRLGYVYENFMVNLRPTNEKLRARIIGIVTTLTSLSPRQAQLLLSETGWDIRAALMRAAQSPSS